MTYPVTSPQPLRTLTELDHLRLSRLLDRAPDEHADALEQTLAQCTVVDGDQIAPDVITMYTRVEVREVDGAEAVYTLCYPVDAEPALGFVSVLSPVGGALIGARIGEPLQVQRPDGSTTTLIPLAILFQPEATGDYST